MIEHAGRGCILSVLIVVAFTLVFHEAQRPPVATAVTGPGRPVSSVVDGKLLPAVGPDPDRRPGERPGLAAAGRHPVPATGPDPPPAAPPPLKSSLVAEASLTLIGLSRPVPAEVRPATTPVPEPGPGAPAQPPAAIRPVPAGPAPAAPQIARRPASSVTIIRQGERLADVALRVYGTPAAAFRIWQANRDRLRGVDAPVAGGLLIRTP